MSRKNIPTPVDAPFEDDGPQFDFDPEQPPENRGEPEKPMPPRRHAQACSRFTDTPLAPPQFLPSQKVGYGSITGAPLPAPAQPHPEPLLSARKATRDFDCAYCGKKHESAPSRSRYCPAPASCRQSAFRQREKVLEGGEPLSIVRLALEAFGQGETRVVSRCLQTLERLHSRTS